MRVDPSGGVFVFSFVVVFMVGFFVVVVASFVVVGLFVMFVVGFFVVVVASFVVFSFVVVVVVGFFMVAVVVVVFVGHPRAGRKELGEVDAATGFAGFHGLIYRRGQRLYIEHQLGIPDLFDLLGREFQVVWTGPGRNQLLYVYLFTPDLLGNPSQRIHLGDNR